MCVGSEVGRQLGQLLRHAELVEEPHARPTKQWCAPSVQRAARASLPFARAMPQHRRQASAPPSLAAISSTRCAISVEASLPTFGNNESAPAVPAAGAALEEQAPSKPVAPVHARRMSSPPSLFAFGHVSGDKALPTGDAGHTARSKEATASGMSKMMGGLNLFKRRNSHDMQKKGAALVALPSFDVSFLDAAFSEGADSDQGATEIF